MVVIKSGNFLYVKKMPNRIEEFRNKKGYTREQLAELCDTTETTIYRLEVEIMELKPEWLYKLGNALEVYPVELLPLDWQKPREVDPTVLGNVLKDIIETCEEIGIKLDTQTIATLTAEKYDRIINHPEEASPEKLKAFLEGVKFNQTKETKK